MEIGRGSVYSLTIRIVCQKLKWGYFIIYFGSGGLVASDFGRSNGNYFPISLTFPAFGEFFGHSPASTLQIIE
jgi:hypothetical protein